MVYLGLLGPHPPSPLPHTKPQKLWMEEPRTGLWCSKTKLLRALRPTAMTRSGRKWVGLQIFMFFGLKTSILPIKLYAAWYKELFSGLMPFSRLMHKLMCNKSRKNKSRSTAKSHGWCQSASCKNNKKYLYIV